MFKLRLLIPFVLVVTFVPLFAQTGWRQFAKNAQHTGLSDVAANPMEKVKWSMLVDTRGSASAHYASPVITGANTVIVTVRTSTGYRYEGHRASDGLLLWFETTDYVPVQNDRGCTGEPVITSDNKLLMPAAGGTIIVRADADAVSSTLTRIAFYGVANYNANPTAYGSVRIRTPLTCDGSGNTFFGYSAGTNPLNITTGIARQSLDGTGTWRSASNAANNNSVVGVCYDSACALSTDETMVYFDGYSSAPSQYLSVVDASTLANIGTMILVSPGTSNPVPYTPNTGSPSIGPDGDAYAGSWGNNGSRGYLHHFDSLLTTRKISGAFGWDSTASVVPTSAVPGYTGSSSYLMVEKYNSYQSGVYDRTAILDPFVSVGGVMNLVQTINGPQVSNEWCMNTTAVDPITKCAPIHNENGSIYRWDFTTNRLTENVQLRSPGGELYAPTAIGPDGTVYAVARERLFAVGPGPHFSPESFTLARGIILSGGLAELLSSDDSRMTLRPGVVLSSTEAPIQLVVESTSPSPSPMYMKFAVESNGNSPSVNQIIQLYDFAHTQYVELDNFRVPSGDSRMEVNAVTSANFVEPGTNKVRAKLSYKAVAPVLSYPWLINIDQVYWAIE